MNLANVLKKSASLVLGGAALVTLYACDGFKDKFNELCKKEPYNWTEQKCSTALTEGYKRNYMVNVAEDAEKGGRKFEINYGALPLEDMLNREISLMNFYRNGLNPQRKEDSRFLDKVGIRDMLIEEFFVRQQRVKWMTFAKNFRTFLDKMGYSGSSGSENGVVTYNDLVKRNAKDNDEGEVGAYNIRFVSPFENLKPLELFSVAAIEAARKKGKLERVQSFKFPFYEQVQRQDPEKPDDLNAKIWKHELRGVEVVAYDVNGDKKKLPDYITVSKMKGRLENGKVVFGKPSEKPSLQIFKSPGSDNPDILVIDSDDDLFPDVVKKIFGINNASDLLFSKKDETIDKLFARNGKNPDEELEGFRRGYQSPEQKFEVAVVGQTRVDEFKVNDSGWSLPDHFNYRNGDGSNYKVEIVWNVPKPKSDSGNRKAKYKGIKYLKKIYHASENTSQEVEGNVVEYFKLPKEYSQRDVRVAEITGTNNQTISITRKGRTNEQWHVDDLLRDTPAFAIEYDKGDKREIIVDKNDDEESNTRYESKKIFSKGENKVPILSDHNGNF